MAGGGDEQQQSNVSYSVAPRYLIDPLDAWGKELENVIEGAPSRYGVQGYEYFPGQTYAGQSPYTQQGLQQLAAGVQAPEAIQATARGDYLGLSPAFQQAVMEPAIENVAGRFNMAGRFGSPADIQAQQEAGMRALAPYYSQERARQLQSAGLLPQYERANIQGLLGAGAGQEAFQQQAINEAMARFEYNRDPLLNRMRAITPLFGMPVAGGTTYGSGSVGGGGGPSGTQRALGGAAAGAAAGSTFGPWGTAIGGVGGGLLGYFS